MSESKKTEYKRETCREKIREIVKRAEEINNGTADYKYYNRIKEMILFGSLVNSDKEKVHDIDILVIWDDNRELGGKFHKEHPRIFKDWIKDMFSEWYSAEKYLRNGGKAYSIHSNVEEGKEIVEMAKSKKYIVLMSDNKSVPIDLDTI